MTEFVVETLDVRTMVPRERHPTIFAHLDALKPGESLRLINDHDPAPLRYQLQAERPDMFTWEPEAQGPEDWVIRIQKNGDARDLHARREPELASSDKRKAAMTRVTRPLRDEHQELIPHIEFLRTVADAIGTEDGASIQHASEEAYQFLTHHLIPHAQAEERVLYPLVGKLMGATQASATMSRDHVAIGQLIEELGSLRSDLDSIESNEAQEKALRRVLYGLYAIVTVHFAKEEEIYLPLLDAHLTDNEASQMFEAMERAAQEARSIA